MGYENKKITMAVLGIFFLVMLVFCDVLINPGTKIITSGMTDTATQFIYFRDFAFTELKKGNLPLWNPYLFCGAPFLGGFQSALLYPPNWIFLFLPVPWAINVSIVLHVMLLGFFMFLWMKKSAVGWLPAFLSSVLIMFSGAHFPHIYAGHLPNLCAMAWIPLIFLCLDRLSGNPQWKWILVGIAAFSMQILAGHPQYVYYTAIVSALYVALKIIFFPREKPLSISLLAILSVFLGGVSLCAVQILTGIEAAGESVRAGGVPYGFASMFSLPPENLLTLVFPNLFGDLLFNPYWGRTYYWESNLFIGVGGLTLALYALVKGGRRERLVGFIIFICLVLALGARTPLFDVFYVYLPGFNQFRGTAKFVFFVDMFISFLSGAGLHLLVSGSRKEMGKITFCLLCCAVLSSMAAVIMYLAIAEVIPLSWWRSILHFIAESGESYLPKALYYKNEFIARTASFAAIQVLIASVVLFLTAVAWLLYTKRGGYFILAIVFLAVLEVLAVAGMTKTSFSVKESLPEGLVKFISTLDKKVRVLNLWRPNLALSTRVGDIWGYDPGVGRRYAEFIAFTQGEAPRHASQYVSFHRYHPLLKLTRLSYIIIPTHEGLKVHEIKDVMPHAVIVYDWRYVEKKEEILEEMAKKDFDPIKTAIVERKLSIRPAPCSFPGKVEIETLDTDTMILNIETICSGLVFLTDNYSKGWRARSLGPDASNYEVLLADYTFMAIPVRAGQHKILLQYEPSGYKIGRRVSIGALVVYVLLGMGYAIFKRKRRKEIETG